MDSCASSLRTHAGLEEATCLKAHLSSLCFKVSRLGLQSLLRGEAANMKYKRAGDGELEDR
ncbi:UNVERIFIED_CONTAM: hypothetical protein FKN15_019326 [Acipenser sinensis]